MHYFKIITYSNSDSYFFLAFPLLYFPVYKQSHMMGVSLAAHYTLHNAEGLWWSILGKQANNLQLGKQIIDNLLLWRRWKWDSFN